MAICYFAHSMVEYNTIREEEARNLFESFMGEGIKLICPNRDLQSKLGKDMNAYLEYVKTCDLVIVLEYHRHVGRGVFEEVRTALDNKIPVFVYREGLLWHVRDVILNDPNDWRFNYGNLAVGEKVDGKSFAPITI